MKKMIIMALGMFTFSCFSQTDSVQLKTFQKGDGIGGFRLGGGFGQGRIAVNCNFRYGYMLTDKISLGPEVSLRTNGKYYQGYGIGGFGRYNFSNHKLIPFAETSYQYGLGYWNNGSKGTDLMSWKSEGHGVFLGGGIGYYNMLNGKLGIELTFGKTLQWYKYEGNILAPSGIQFNHVWTPGLRATWKF